MWAGYGDLSLRLRPERVERVTGGTSGTSLAEGFSERLSMAHTGPPLAASRGRVDGPCFTGAAKQPLSTEDPGEPGAGTALGPPEAREGATPSRQLHGPRVVWAADQDKAPLPALVTPS